MTDYWLCLVLPAKLASKPYHTLLCTHGIEYQAQINLK